MPDMPGELWWGGVVWGGEACGKDGVLLAAPSAPPRQCHVGRGKAAAPS